MGRGLNKERGTGISTGSSRAEFGVAASFSSIGFAKGTLQLDSAERTRTQQAAGLRCPPVRTKEKMQALVIEEVATH